MQSLPKLSVDDDHGPVAAILPDAAVRRRPAARGAACLGAAAYNAGNISRTAQTGVHGCATCAASTSLSRDDKLAPPDAETLRSWLTAAARKDRQAFRRLYDATAPKLFGYALRILVKREAAEEALQESFISIWNNAAGYQSALASPMTWMTAIVRNKALDLLRRADHDIELDAGHDRDGGMPDLMATLESGEPAPADALQLSQNAAALARCLQRLEGLHRQAIAMAFYHELSHTEVAAQLRLPIGTVKTWIRRGLERLKLCLTRMEGA